MRYWMFIYSIKRIVFFFKKKRETNFLSVKNKISIWQIIIWEALDMQAVNQKKTAEKIIIWEALDVQALLWCFICMEFVLEAEYKLYTLRTREYINK